MEIISVVLELNPKVGSASRTKRFTKEMLLPILPPGSLLFIVVGNTQATVIHHYEVFPIDEEQQIPRVRVIVHPLSEVDRVELAHLVSETESKWQACT